MNIELFIEEMLGLNAFLWQIQRKFSDVIDRAPPFLAPLRCSFNFYMHCQFIHPPHVPLFIDSIAFIWRYPLCDLACDRCHRLPLYRLDLDIALHLELYHSHTHLSRLITCVTQWRRMMVSHASNTFRRYLSLRLTFYFSRRINAFGKRDQIDHAIFESTTESAGEEELVGEDI